MRLDEFIKQYQKVPVECYPHQVNQNPLVSVCVITYQHGKFIKDCLQGIVSQETNFSFEVLVGEDDSKDETRQVCIDFAKTYPDKIKLFLHTRENNILNEGKPSGRFNFVYNLLSVRGEFVALCEGDDYWTDPLKLQKQVDALRANSSFSMCTHETYHVHYPKGAKQSLRRALSIMYRDLEYYGWMKLVRNLFLFFFQNDSFWSQERSHMDQKRKKFVYLKDLSNNRWFMSFCSILFRREIIDPLPDCYLTTWGAHQLTLLLGTIKGGIVHLGDVMAVKRDQQTSFTKDIERKRLNRQRESDPGISNRVKRFRCLQQYADGEQREVLEGMVKEYVLKKSKLRHGNFA